MHTRARTLHFALFTAFWASFSWATAFLSSAEPLTESLVRHARKIVLYPGTYDPLNRGHLKRIEDALGPEVQADLVILLPSRFLVHKEGTALSHRLNMIHAALKDSPKASYPWSGELFRVYSEQSTARFVGALRKLNPTLDLQVLIGEDVAQSVLATLSILFRIHPSRWIVGARGSLARPKITPLLDTQSVQFLQTNTLSVSSSRARAYLYAHPELYAGRGSDPGLEELLPQNVSRYIMEHGLYLDLPSLDPALRSRYLSIDIARTLFRHARQSGWGVLRSLGIWKTAHRFEFHAAERDGEPFILKQPIDTDAKRTIDTDASAAWWVLRVSAWLNAHTGIHAAPIVDYAPDGSWLIQKLHAEGTVADKIASDTLGWLEAEALKKLYDEAASIERINGLGLDLRADQIAVNDDHATLLHFEPRQKGDARPKTFSDQMRLWRGQARADREHPSAFTRCSKALSDQTDPSRSNR